MTRHRSMDDRDAVKRQKEARDEWRDLTKESKALVVVPTPDSIPPIDLSDPRSLLNLLPSDIQDHALKLPVALFELHPEDLELLAFKDGFPKTLFRKLRIAFWEEYDITQSEKKDKIDMNRVFKKSCSPSYFRVNIQVNDPRLALLLTPPSEYDLSLKEISSLGLERMKEALEIPVDQRDPNTKLIEAQLKIFQHADMRLKGSVVQRIEQRALNMNLNANASPEMVDKAEVVSKMSMEEIEAEIRRFEGRSKAAEIPGTVHVDLMKDTRPIKAENTIEQPKAAAAKATPTGTLREEIKKENQDPS